MTQSERGAYLTLIGWDWLSRGKGLPNDPTILRKLAHGPVTPRVLECFEENEEGRLFNPKVREQWKESEEFAEKQASNGRLGGRPKKNPGLSFGLTQTEPKRKPPAREEEEEKESSLLFEVEHRKETEEESQAANPVLPSLPSDPRSVLRAELEWRAREAWRVHADAWREYLTRRDGYPPGQRQEKALVAAERVTLPLILDALKRHDGALLGAEQRERWAEDSVVRAAGIGIFHDPWCTAADARNKRAEGGTEYLEHWRPWKIQRSKEDPVPRFAALYFASLETWERRRGQ